MIGQNFPKMLVSIHTRRATMKILYDYLKILKKKQKQMSISNKDFLHYTEVVERRILTIEGEMLEFDINFD